MEDLRIVICVNEQDADAERARWQAALPDAKVRIVKRRIQDLPLMDAVSCRQETPFSFSVQVSNNLLEAWVVCIEVV